MTPISNALKYLLVIAAVCSPAAAEAPKPAPRSTDDAPAGDDYDRALLGESGKADAKDHGGDLESKLKQELGRAAQREDEQKDPLQQAAEAMREVQGRLAQRDSDAVTQQVQRQVVADLDAIIEQMKKSPKNSGSMESAGPQKKGGSAGAKPRTDPDAGAPNRNPARESTPEAKPPRDDEKNLARKIKVFRDRYTLGLPEHGREQMLELPSEYFLPQYEREIEDYFRRLSSGKAEERP